MTTRMNGLISFNILIVVCEIFVWVIYNSWNLKSRGSLKNDPIRKARFRSPESRIFPRLTAIFAMIFPFWISMKIFGSTWTDMVAFSTIPCCVAHLLFRISRCHGGMLVSEKLNWMTKLSTSVLFAWNESGSISIYLFIASLIVIYDSTLFLRDLDQLAGDWNEQISFSNIFC